MSCDIAGGFAAGLGAARRGDQFVPEQGADRMVIADFTGGLDLARRGGLQERNDRSGFDFESGREAADSRAALSDPRGARVWSPSGSRRA
jgi:hypothetical protein